MSADTEPLIEKPVPFLATRKFKNIPPDVFKCLPGVPPGTAVKVVITRKVPADAYWVCYEFNQ